MSDNCQISLIELMTMLYDNSVKKLSNLVIQAFKSGWGNLASIVNDVSMEGFKDMLSSAIMAGGGYLGTQAIAGLSSLVPGISLLMNVLTAGQQAYLSVQAMIYTYYRYEIQNRILVLTLLSGNLDKIIFLLDMLMNSKALESDKENQRMVNEAYKYISSATNSVSDAKSQQENLGYYSVSNLKTASYNLDKAHDVLKTPILEAIGKAFDQARFIDNSPLEALGRNKDANNILSFPSNMVEEIENLSNGTRTFEKSEEDLKKRIHSWKDVEDTLYAGVAEYLNLPIGIIGIQSEMTKVLESSAKYLPVMGAGLYNVINTGGNLKDMIGTAWKGISGKDRTLKNLNSVIKMMYFLMSMFEDSWKVFNLVKDVSSDILSSIYGTLSALRDDVGDHASISGDQINPKVKAKAAIAVKINLWKVRIKNNKRMLDSISETMLGTQQEGLGIAYRNLDLLKAHLISFKTNYTDDSEHTPNSDGAYKLLNAIYLDFFDSLFNKEKMKKFVNTLKEGRMLIYDAIEDDKKVLSFITAFTSSVINIPSIKEHMILLDTFLNSDKYGNSPIAIIIKDLKMGNLNKVSALMAQLGGFTEAVDSFFQGVAFFADNTNVAGLLGGVIESTFPALVNPLNCNKAGEATTQDTASAAEEATNALRTEEEVIRAAFQEAEVLDAYYNRLSEAQTSPDSVEYLDINEEGFDKFRDSVYAAMEEDTHLEDLVKLTQTWVY
jgi:hypothetical protein